jgi:hypothetical protein
VLRASRRDVVIYEKGAMMPERAWKVTLLVEDQKGELWELTRRVMASKRDDALATALAQARTAYFHARSVTAHDAVEASSSDP